MQKPFPSPTLDPKRVPEPQAFVEQFGAFALDGTELLQIRPAEAAPASTQKKWSLDLGGIRHICVEKVPGWSMLTDADLIVDQLLAGLSNQLFKVYVCQSVLQRSECAGVVPCVLFRIYGKEVQTLIDSELEIEMFKTLSNYQIAPKMYGNGDGWRIEEWHFAVSLKCRYMRNPSILTQVAAALGRFHKLSFRQDFPRHFRSLPPASLQRIERWAKSCEVAAARPGLCKESTHALQAMNIQELVAEQQWLRSYVTSDDPNIRGSGLDVVFSHNDVQENNILQTHYGLRFIDFEYASMDYQSFDIANYFCECCLDYLHDKYPFYSISLSDYPSEWEQRLFCSIYLSEYLESRIALEDLAVTRLLQRVNRFVLVSQYLWTVWSVVRAPDTITFNDFDFLHYAQARWDSYKRTKSELLNAEGMQAPVPTPFTPSVSLADLQSDANGMMRTPSERSGGGEQKPVPPKMSFILMGGALTGCGVLVGVMAVVTVIKALKR